jgi:MYXO-CTERM domain-containing protein
MPRLLLPSLCFSFVVACPAVALATKSAELYTSAPHGYGRVEARVRFAAGDGVVSSFFLWKDGSEVTGTFWNELDFEKVGADCRLETNALFGSPGASHTQRHTSEADLCDGFHLYAYEWTPEAIVWTLDGVELRRDTGATATAFADNAAAGMQIRFNIWPGNASFGGNFSPSILPVHQYVDWVEFSSYADGEFTFEWREEFDGDTLPTGWLTGSWGSPKNLSTHDPGNVNLVDGYVVLSLTTDDAVGPACAKPEDGEGVPCPAAPPPPPSGDDGGCSVSGAHTSPSGAWLGALGLAALAALGRRARSRARRGVV